MIENSFSNQDIEIRMNVLNNYLLERNINIDPNDIQKITINLMNISISHGGTVSVDELLTYLKIYIDKNILNLLIK